MLFRCLDQHIHCSHFGSIKYLLEPWLVRSIFETENLLQQWIAFGCAATMRTNSLMFPKYTSAPNLIVGSRLGRTKNHEENGAHKRTRKALSTCAWSLRQEYRTCGSGIFCGKPLSVDPRSSSSYRMTMNGTEINGCGTPNP